MIVQINPSPVLGQLKVPASKSAMQRACAAALIRKGKSVLHHPGYSRDDETALQLIQQLGATVSRHPGQVEILSNGIMPVENHLNCGESGLSLRMFTALAATTGESFTITGAGSLLARPVHFFEEVFPSLGVSVQSNNGFLPVEVNGPIQLSDITVDGSFSSQYLTGLLFAYSAMDAADVTIRVKDLKSQPYIELTLQLMQEFGLKTPHKTDDDGFYFPRTSTTEFNNPVIHYQVEGDWSNAALLMVAGAIGGDLVVEGLDVFSSQGDKAILQALMQAGALLSIETDTIHVRKNKLNSFHVNATHTPDLFPPLVALAAYAEGTSVIEGVHRLYHKESNRALTLQQEFGKLGLEITIQDDLMIIKSGMLKAGKVHSCNDHRIAMALAVAAIGAEGAVIIEQAEAVHKSYPHFFQDLQKIGVSLSLA